MRRIRSSRATAVSGRVPASSGAGGDVEDAAADLGAVEVAEADVEQHDVGLALAG